MIKNNFSDDGKRYYTCDPHKVAYLMVRGCKREKIDDKDTENILFTLYYPGCFECVECGYTAKTVDDLYCPECGGTMRELTIDLFLNELHSGTAIDPNRFISYYKEVMGIIRDIRATKGKKTKAVKNATVNT